MNGTKICANGNFLVTANLNWKRTVEEEVLRTGDVEAYDWMAKNRNLVRDGRKSLDNEMIRVDGNVRKGSVCVRMMMLEELFVEERV